MCGFMGTGQADSFYIQGFDFGVWEELVFIKNRVIKIWSVVHIYSVILGTIS